MGLGTQVAVDNRFSPMSLFIQPKADATLIELAALQELNHPGVPLFPQGSPSADRLKEVMRQMPDYYERAIAKQRKAREPKEVEQGDAANP